MKNWNCIELLRKAYVIALAVLELPFLKGPIRLFVRTLGTTHRTFCASLCAAARARVDCACADVRPLRESATALPRGPAQTRKVLRTAPADVPRRLSAPKPLFHCRTVVVCPPS